MQWTYNIVNLYKIVLNYFKIYVYAAMRIIKTWCLTAIIMLLGAAFLSWCSSAFLYGYLVQLQELTQDALFVAVGMIFVFIFSGIVVISVFATRFSGVFPSIVQKGIDFETAMLSLGFIEKGEQIIYARHLRLTPYISYRPLHIGHVSMQKGRVYAAFNTNVHDFKKTKNLLADKRLFFDEQEFVQAATAVQRAIDRVYGEKLLAQEKQITLLEGEAQALREKNTMISANNIELQNKLKANQGTLAAMKKNKDNTYIAEQIGKIVAAVLQTKFGEQKFTKDNIYDFLDKSFVLPPECRALLEQHNTSFSKVRTKVMEEVRTLLPADMKCKRGESKLTISE